MRELDIPDRRIVKGAIRKLIALVLVMSMAFSGSFALFISSQVEAYADASVETAVQWALTVAADDTHGYSQSDRWGPDYDCSSFVISAFAASGFTGIVAGSGNTSDMRATFTSAGFTWITWTDLGGSAGLQRGDILLKEGSHAELALGDGTVVGAHSDRGNPETGDQSGKEISIATYYNYDANGWDGVLRYSGSDAVNTTSDTGVEADGTSTAYQAYSAEYAGTYVVNTASDPLNLRRAPDTATGTVVAQIPKGAVVTVVSAGTSADGTLWAYCYYGTFRGYCSMQFLVKQGDIDINAEDIAEETVFDEGDTFSVGKLKYEVIAVDTDSEEPVYEVAVTGLTASGKKATSITFPDYVTYKDTEFKLTEISDNSCKLRKNLKKITIGAYVEYIGERAFANCTSLKQVKFKGKKLEEVGEKAFKKTWYKGIKVIAPTKSKLKKYKKLLSQAGVNRFR